MSLERECPAVWVSCSTGGRCLVGGQTNALRGPCCRGAAPACPQIVGLGPLLQVSPGLEATP